jgi:hypothetical protein
MFVTKDTCKQANSKNSNPTGWMLVSRKKEEGDCIQAEINNVYKIRHEATQQIIEHEYKKN